MPSSSSERADTPSHNRTPLSRYRLALGWFLLVAVLAVLWQSPIRSGMSRTLILADAVLVWAVGLIAFRRSRIAVVVLVALAFLTGAAAVLPGRAVDSVVLRDQYVETLRGYTGTAYVWGGETHRGIDCSGLVRCALAEAEFREGAKTLNPRLLRGAFALWCNDASALSLRYGYGNHARELREIRSLNTAPNGFLAPGDFAVTASGGHTLAYLGGNTWISADPTPGKVVTYRTPDPHQAWLNVPLVILRWHVLEP